MPKVLGFGRILRAFVVVATLAGGVGAAQADEVLADRLSALLGQERQALEIVPSARMAALTAPPPATLRNVQTAPAELAYNQEYLASLPGASGGSEWECLAEALYFEARGESVRGMFAVSEVILNRVNSGAYPNTVCDVVHQGTGRRFACQFTYTCDGISDAINERGAWLVVGKVARVMLDGGPFDLTNGATHYHTRAVQPSWARRFPQTAAIGSHLFYRQSTQTASN